MLAGLTNFFNSVISFFETIYSFIVNLVTSLLALIQVLMTTQQLPIVFETFLLPIIGTSMLIVIAIGVIYKIVGR